MNKSYNPLNFQTPRKYSVMIKQTGAPGKLLQDQRLAYWRNHNKVVNHIKEQKGVDKAFINSILFSNFTLNDNHITICEKIVADAIVLDLPYPNTLRSSNFSKIRGSASTSTGQQNKVPGCYYITDNVRSYI